MQANVTTPVVAPSEALLGAAEKRVGGSSPGADGETKRARVPGHAEAAPCLHHTPVVFPPLSGIDPKRPREGENKPSPSKSGLGNAGLGHHPNHRERGRQKIIPEPITPLLALFQDAMPAVHVLPMGVPAQPPVGGGGVASPLVQKADGGEAAHVSVVGTPQPQHGNLGSSIAHNPQGGGGDNVSPSRATVSHTTPSTASVAGCASGNAVDGVQHTDQPNVPPHSLPSDGSQQGGSAGHHAGNCDELTLSIDASMREQVEKEQDQGGEGQEEQEKPGEHGEQGGQEGQEGQEGPMQELMHEQTQVRAGEVSGSSECDEGVVGDVEAVGACSEEEERAEELLRKQLKEQVRLADVEIGPLEGHIHKQERVKSELTTEVQRLRQQCRSLQQELRHSVSPHTVLTAPPGEPTPALPMFQSQCGVCSSGGTGDDCSIGVNAFHPSSLKRHIESSPSKGNALPGHRPHARPKAVIGLPCLLSSSPGSAPSPEQVLPPISCPTSQQLPHNHVL